MAASTPAFRRKLLLHVPAVMALALLCGQPATSAGISRSGDITIAHGGMTIESEADTINLRNFTIQQGTGTRIQAEEGLGTNIDSGYKDTHWTLRGKVRLEFEGTVLDADSASVQFANGKVVSASVEGSPSRFSRTATNSRTVQGTAPSIRYQTESGWVRFDGRTWFSTGTYEFEGNQFNYNVKTRTAKDDEDDSTMETVTRRERAPDVPTPRTPDRSTAQ